jgi:hypothetical protein
VAREPVAVIETHGLPIKDEDANAVVSAVTHLLLAQKRRWREHPEEEASGPLAVDLDDVARHRSTCVVCSDQERRGAQSSSPTPLPASMPSVFDDLEWAPRATDDVTCQPVQDQR